MVRVRFDLLWLSFVGTFLIESNAWKTSDWMKDHMKQIGERTLKQICIPGTHNSGMNQINGKTASAKSCNILHQSGTILKQLELGIRFFDVKPVISQGKFKTGYYRKNSEDVWEGGNGQFMHSIVNDINKFTKNHNELVIIYLSQSLNTDMKYRSFNQEEWNRLFQLLDRTRNLFVTSRDAYLPDFTLRNLTGNWSRSSVVYIIHEREFDLGDRFGKGYFNWKSLALYLKYSETNDFSVMLEDQINKMKTVSHSRYFLFPWTLTLSSDDVAMCPIGTSVKLLAKNANENLHTIVQYVSENAYPNIISVDYVENNEVTLVTLAVNNLLDF
ncbi:unnamed protein product [Nezara viridula]|uniref:Phosphatidylinositol-specific phospholipase C X domain-containing protein n=1 Tax=Nezara viridula TaxID=85310 RepID=A0A9P0EEG8_NEZVI|nr:unnamed protein product [Nezara viridula]